MVCFTCLQKEASVDYVSIFLKIHGIPVTDNEKRNILKVFCQLLHAKWGPLEQTFSDSVVLPLCETCLKMIVELVKLREELFQIESDMRSRIMTIEMMIANEQDTNDMGLEDDITEVNGDPRLASRRQFQRDVMEEHRNKILLMRKKKERMERFEHEDCIEVEPSFVQLDFKLVAVDTEKVINSAKPIIEESQDVLSLRNAFDSGQKEFYSMEFKEKVEEVEVTSEFFKGIFCSDESSHNNASEDSDYKVPRKKPKAKSKSKDDLSSQDEDKVPHTSNINQTLTKMFYNTAGDEYLPEHGVDSDEMLSNSGKSSYSDNDSEHLDAKSNLPAEPNINSANREIRQVPERSPRKLMRKLHPCSPRKTPTNSPKKYFPWSPTKELSNKKFDQDQVEYRAKDGSIWTTEEPHKCRTRYYNILREDGGVIGPAANANLSPGELFKLTVTPEIVDLVVKHTNEFAAAYLEEQGKQKKGMRWTPVTQEDIYAYIGIILYLGVEKDRPISELWTTNPKYTNDLVVATMGRSRFSSISSFLRFDNRAERHKAESQGIMQEKLAYISEVFDPFVKNIQSHFRPYDSLVVDEMLIRFKGHAKFRVYMKSKPGKYGMKIWALCDAETGYVLRLMIYGGKKGDKVETQLGMKVVLSLVEKYFKTGRSVTTDNFFTSKALAQELMTKGMSLLGTLNHSRMDVIPEFLDGRGRELESSVFAFQKDFTMVSYMQRKNRPVLLLSTLHHTADVSDYKNKPQLILDYNRTKGGVDTADQMIRHLTCQRATRRWPMKIFQAMCDIAALNAYVIWNCVHGRPGKAKMERRLFVRQVSESLIKPCIRTRAQSSRADCLPAHVKSAMGMMGFQRKPISSNVQVERGRCQMLNVTNRVTKRCRIQTLNRCDGCSLFLCKKHSRRIMSCGECEFVHVIRENFVSPELQSSV